MLERSLGRGLRGQCAGYPDGVSLNIVINRRGRGGSPRRTAVETEIADFRRLGVLSFNQQAGYVIVLRRRADENIEFCHEAFEYVRWGGRGAGPDCA
jgi:hypothetical protein